MRGPERDPGRNPESGEAEVITLIAQLVGYLVIAAAASCAFAGISIIVIANADRKRRRAALRVWAKAEEERRARLDHLAAADAFIRSVGGKVGAK